MNKKACAVALSLIASSAYGAPTRTVIKVRWNYDPHYFDATITHSNGKELMGPSQRVLRIVGINPPQVELHIQTQEPNLERRKATSQCELPRRRLAPILALTSAKAQCRAAGSVLNGRRLSINWDNRPHGGRSVQMADLDDFTDQTVLVTRRR